jgi:hypothetical protein
MAAGGACTAARALPLIVSRGGPGAAEDEHGSRPARGVEGEVSALGPREAAAEAPAPDRCRARCCAASRSDFRERLERGGGARLRRGRGRGRSPARARGRPTVSRRTSMRGGVERAAYLQALSTRLSRTLLDRGAVHADGHGLRSWAARTSSPGPHAAARSASRGRASCHEGLEIDGLPRRLAPSALRRARRRARSPPRWTEPLRLAAAAARCTRAAPCLGPSPCRPASMSV